MTCKLVLEDPRGQGLSSRTTTLVGVYCIAFMQLHRKYPIRSNSRSTRLNWPLILFYFTSVLVFITAKHCTIVALTCMLVVSRTLQFALQSSAIFIMSYVCRVSYHV